MLSKDDELQGRYKIERQLGEGGMAIVYEAFDNRLKSRVALKETITGEAEFINAFRKEAQLLANLNHPSLPRVTDHFSEGNAHYLVMDFIEGDDLKVYLEKNPGGFPVENVVFTADQLLNVLQYLHNQPVPIIHRDIKPANLKVKNGKLFLLDFGLARGTAGEMSQASSQKGLHGYTPSFASIEQIQGRNTSPASDIYSLAATLYQMVTGKVPADALERAIALATGKPDPLINIKHLKPELDENFAKGIMQAMSVEAVARPQNAQTMKKFLFPNSFEPTLVQGASPSRAITEKYTAESRKPGSIETGDRVQNAFNLSHSTAQKPATRKKSKMLYVLAAILGIFIFGAAAIGVGGWIYVSRNGSPFVDKRENAVKLTREAEEFLAAGKYQQAIETSKKSIESDPNYAPAYVVYGDANWDSTYMDVVGQEERVESNKSADKIVEIVKNPSTAEDFMALAWAYAAKSDAKKSVENANKAIALKENFPMAFMIRGGSLMALSANASGDEAKFLSAQAISNFDEAIRLRPNYAQVYMLRADALVSAKEYTKAISDLTEAIRILPEARYYKARGDAYWFSEKYDNARKEYEEALKLNPQYRKAYIGLGDTFYFLKKYKDADAAYQKAKAINPNEYYLYHAMGNNYIELKKYDEAVAAYTRAIELKPTDFYSYQARAAAYRELGQKDLAKSDLATAKKLEDQDSVK